MSRLKQSLAVAVVGVVLAVCLFADTRVARASGWFGAIVQEVLATFRDPSTQWMVFACAGVYYVTFSVLRRREAVRFGAPGVTRPILGFADGDFSLAGGLLIATLAYAFQYATAATSTGALMLLAGVTLGQGAGVWAAWGGNRRAANGGCKTSNSEHLPLNKVATVITVLLVLLVAAVFMKDDLATPFQYRGQARWKGPWDNPNVFGMLMGVGVVLAAGRVLSFGTWHVSRFERARLRYLTLGLSPVGAEREQKPEGKSETRSPKSEIVRRLKVACFAAAAVICGVGLVKSYSRGAWVGAVVGLAYLGWRYFRSQESRAKGEKAEGRRQTPEVGQQRSEGGAGESKTRNPKSENSAGASAGVPHHPPLVTWLARNWVPVAVFMTSLLVLAFWNFRHAELSVIRRAFSVVNRNDFSWRNRLAAWEGAWQMMADKPWIGFGWNQPERVYDQYYRAPQESEGMAFQTNDYLVLGTTLGIPALVCFVAYIGLSLRRNPVSLSPAACPLSSQTVCRAGAIVLLAAFGFDCGLFKLATGATFWILLELGTAQHHAVEPNS